MCDNCNSTEPTSDVTDIPIVCTPSAMGDDWDHHVGVIHRWQDAIVEVVELPNGYAFRFPAQTDLLMTLAEFVTRERLCCPFFTFQIEVNPAGELWLRLTGPAGTKLLIEQAQNGFSVLDKIRQLAGQES